MAEALLLKKLQQSGKEHEIEVQSAGIRKFKGTSTSLKTITVLAEYGIECNREPQGITLELGEWADLILTMTKFHQWVLKLQFPQFRSKTFTLKEFIGESQSINIADPVGGSLAKYRQCAEEIDQILDRLLEQLIFNP